MSNESHIAIVTVPLEEWNQQKAMIFEIKEQLNELVRKDQKELLTPREVCEVLKISRATYERYVNNGIIKPTRIGGKKYSKVLISNSHIEKLISEGVV